MVRERGVKDGFGVRMRRLRRARGLSLERLARAAGIQKGYLSMIERGNARPPSPRVVKALARALGEDAMALLIAAHVEKAPPEIRAALERAVAAAGNGAGR